MPGRTNICLWIMGIFLLSNVYAQQPDLRLVVKRQNNFTYSTTLDIDYQKEVGKYRFDLVFHHDNLYNSIRERDRFVQFYIRTRLWQYYRLSDKWEATSWITTDQFVNGQNQRYNLYGGLTYKPLKNISLTPLIGYSWDVRSGILDQGFSPAFIASGSYAWPDGLKMRTSIYGRLKFIDPRFQRNIVIRSEWSKTIGDYTDAELGISIGSNEINDYKSSSIEQIQSDTIRPNITFRYQLRPGWYWDSDNRLSITRRKFDYKLLEGPEAEFNNLSFDHIEFQTSQKLSIASKKWMGYLSFSFQQLDRQYQLENSMTLRPTEFERLLLREEQKDFQRELIQWDLFAQLQLNPRNQLTLTGTNQYVQFDTPSASNFDDHDELNYSLAVEWKTNWSRNFLTQYKITGSVRRYSFLFQERSQDNYIQRNLRLNFRYKWNILDNLTMEGKQYIYVTYNVKDFEDINRTDRSTRNLESFLDVTYRPKKQWDVALSLYRREVHLSFLDWQAFSETPLDTTITYITSLINSWHVLQNNSLRLTFQGGYKHVSQTRKFNTSMTNLENFLVPINLKSRSLQTGAFTGFQLKKRVPASLDVSIWWQIQYQDFQFKEIDELTSISANFRQEVLEEVKVLFRPFFNLRMNLWLSRPGNTRRRKK